MRLRLLVCGDRLWGDKEAIRERILALSPGVIIHGGAQGADTLAGLAAAELGIPTEVYPAQWVRLGRAAGMIRNQQMLDEGRPDYVLAFHDDLAHSKGTANMIRRAEKAGIPVEVWSHTVRLKKEVSDA